HSQQQNNPTSKMVPVLMLLMVALVAAESDTDSVSVVHCDASTYCPDGTTCCLNPYGSWGCCPYPMSLSFDQALQQKSQTEQVHCDGDVYCPTEQFCCKTSAGQWGCCSGLVL
ncbi:hypothetical protein cypCar_00045171, partial [Cyprinus carpio]